MLVNQLFSQHPENTHPKVKPVMWQDMNTQLRLLINPSLHYLGFWKNLYMAFGLRHLSPKYILAIGYKHIDLEWCTRVFIQASTFVPPLHPCCIYKGFGGCFPFTGKNRNSKTTLWCHITFSAIFDVITQYLRLAGAGKGVACSKAYSALGAFVSADSLLKSVLQHLLQVKLTSPKVEPTDGLSVPSRREKA